MWEVCRRVDFGRFSTRATILFGSLSCVGESCAGGRRKSKLTKHPLTCLLGSMPCMPRLQKVSSEVKLLPLNGADLERAAVEVGR